MSIASRIATSHPRLAISNAFRTLNPGFCCMQRSKIVHTTPNLSVSWGRLWKLSFGLATVLGASSAAFVYFGMIIGGRPLTLRTAILAGLPDWYFWACLTPVVFWIGLRFRLDQHALRALLVLIPIGIVVVLGELLVFTTFNHLFYYNPWAPAPSDFHDAYVRDVFRSFHYGYLIYWGIIGAAQSFAFYREARERTQQATLLREHNAELEGMLTRAQLEVLRGQLRPHFLFNAFNTISGLIRDGRSIEATDMVAHLGQLFRQTLKVLERNTIPLHEELQLVTAYVGIERARFGDRLEVRFDVPPALMNCMVPSMLLQPLVENAIHHGLHHHRGGRIVVGAAIDGSHLQLHVEDSASAAHHDTNEANGNGIALSNMRARLERLYNGRYAFELVSSASGTVVLIRIPVTVDQLELAS